MNAGEHGRWNDDLPGYLLGALEPSEAAALERHLDGCERCREELSWLAPAVATLPESVPRLEPPEGLRARVMAEAQADAAAVEGGYRHRARERSGGRLAALRFLLTGERGWRPLAALAATALVLVAVVGYEVGSDSGGSGGDGGGSTLSAGRAPGVTATMVREGSGGVLRLANVHQLPGDEVLEAWVRREGRVEAVPALFVPDREGNAATEIANMSGVDTVMVTEEPKGGSAEPTSEPIVTMEVPQ